MHLARGAMARLTQYGTAVQAGSSAHQSEEVKRERKIVYGEGWGRYWGWVTREPRQSFLALLSRPLSSSFLNSVGRVCDGVWGGGNQREGQGSGEVSAGVTARHNF